jgi:hypothetical protein
MIETALQTFIFCKYFFISLDRVVVISRASRDDFMCASCDRWRCTERAQESANHENASVMVRVLSANVNK